MAFPGLASPAGGAAEMDPQKLQEQMMIKYISTIGETCPAKFAISGVAGFGLGGVFGLFMASMRYDTPLSSGIPGGVGTQIKDIPIREQLKAGFKDMGKSAWGSAKNFGYIGAIFSGSECAIEGLRAKNDLGNSVAAGCFTGGFLAKNAGPQAMAVGCAGFAAFSAAIDAYMKMPSDDKASDPII